MRDSSPGTRRAAAVVLLAPAVLLGVGLWLQQPAASVKPQDAVFSAQLNGSTTLKFAASAPGPKVIRKWSLMRRLLKCDAYKTAALAPRPSDVDFQVDEAMASETAPIEKMSIGAAQGLVEEFTAPAQRMAEFFKATTDNK